MQTSGRVLQFWCSLMGVVYVQSVQEHSSMSTTVCMRTGRNGFPGMGATGYLTPFPLVILLFIFFHGLFRTVGCWD